MKSKPITTLLFDFDGTLLDTNELIIQTFLSVLGKRYPGRFTKEDVLHFIGPSLKQTFDSIDETLTEELIKEYRAWNIEMHDQMAVEFDGVADTLRILKARGIKMAIVSTKKQDIIQRGLKLMGIEDIFEVVIALDDVVNPKPDPEPIVLALNRLNASKEEALMIGDNSHDIEGGQNAGVRTAGVAWTAKGEAYLATFNPTYMLQHITDLLEIVDGPSS
ncbi:pyrophosphatase PpaX [Paenisporosarcina quisquiliarum]|uniref:Pyrophosphatase PpaX n=1 Tax=Paenisporosarcina quisquiliarum TaxID=365346 RepID=A0A9X3LHM1_9BACL|nr:pyrophosphatase PpaX [Paenisporosarcina quisquiliarum]MCZ8537505.1 pyrophosphatase PpaX [Paenisporosarcina quisquiliarum]